MEVFPKYYEKRAIESRVEQVYQIRPEHLNGAGRLFGGRLMEWIDEVAGLVGIRHSQCNVITASVDNLKFIRGVFQNDLVVLVGTLTGRQHFHGSPGRYLCGKNLTAHDIP